MRACHVMPAYPDVSRLSVGGLPYRELVQRLSVADIPCVAVTARQFPDSPTEEQDGAVPVRRFVFGAHASRLGEIAITPGRAWRYRRAGLRTIRAVAQELPYDLLHAHSPLPCGLLALAAARRPRVPVIVTLHGSDVLIHGRRNAAVRRATGWVLRRADRVIAVSDHLVDAARTYAPGVAATVIPMGYDDATYCAGVPAAAREPLVVSTRSLFPLYSVDTLVRAARSMPEGHSMRVAIFGEGPERDGLAAQAEGAPVCFHGFQPPAVLAEALRRAAVYVSTAESDGSSISLLEALACGAYPVLTDIPGNRRWVDDGVNGRLVPPGDAAALGTALAEAMDDTSARERAMAINVERAREASWPAVVEQVRAVYASVIEESRG